MIAICANIGSPPFSPISIGTFAAAIRPDVYIRVNRVILTARQPLSSNPESRQFPNQPALRVCAMN
ncbi:MAG TPA: hypothetical protein VNO32_17020 [Candidatus Acidoferrum sp.]|jgi:hypothetical protein|nr:hypothetical protein [Candidatus Acidoferrum sp.]